MLRFKVIDKIQAQGHLKPFTYLCKTIGMSNTKATRYKNDKQQNISLAELSSLCRALHCTPNDLLYWQQDDKTPLPETHPCLSQLSPPPKESNWATLLQMMSDEDRDKVYAEIQRQIDKKEAAQPE